MVEARPLHLSERRDVVARSARATSPPGAISPTGRPSTETASASRELLCSVSTSSGEIDERARAQRVRSDERHGHARHAPGHHRAAVGEVVAGRSGRRGDDEAVAAHAADLLAADRVGELGDAAADLAVQRDVVERDVALRRRLELDRRQASARRACRPAPVRSPRVIRSGSTVERKPTSPKLTANTGHRRARVGAQRAQDRAVAAERHAQLGIERERRVESPRPRPPPRPGACAVSSVSSVSTAPAATAIAARSRSAAAVSSGRPCVSTLIVLRRSSADRPPARPPRDRRAIRARPRRARRTSRCCPSDPAGPRAGSRAPRRRARRAAAATSSSARRRSAPSRTTPPLPTSPRPTSNCGLTRHSASKRGAAQASTRRQHRAQRDERRGRPRSPRERRAARRARSSRALKRSITVTRGSPRSFQLSSP